jgi:hypothetical protein
MRRMATTHFCPRSWPLCSLMPPLSFFSARLTHYSLARSAIMAPAFLTMPPFISFVSLSVLMLLLLTKQTITFSLYCTMFTYLPVYRVLICSEHQHAVYNLDEHLKRLHKLPVVERQRVIALYKGISLCPLDQVLMLELYTAAIVRPQL